MSESLKQRIEELNRKLAFLKEKRGKLNLEARGWAEIRNSLHEQIKALRTKVSDLKEKRDALNERVKELKNLREQARTERREKSTQILKLKEKLKRLAKKKPSQNMHYVENEIEKLEWKIQTTSLPVNEEKLLIDQVRVLETQLSLHKQIQKLGNALFELQTEEKALETRADFHHEKLSELAEQSQSFHEKITVILSKVNTLRVEADAKHQKYVEFKQQAQTVHQEQTELLRQINSLREELHQMEEKKQVKRQRELRKDLMKKASEKLKQGKKLTWEEFKILAEKKKVKSLKTRKK
jgi:uncharacterized coiled-coil DUF342 family protein